MQGGWISKDALYPTVQVIKKHDANFVYCFAFSACFGVCPIRAFQYPITVSGYTLTVNLAVSTKSVNGFRFRVSFPDIE